MGVFTFFQNRKNDKLAKILKDVERDLENKKQDLENKKQDLAKLKTISENIEKFRREKSEKADR
jgi:hypothetical protein